ncbi:SRPBCC family protein [Chitinophaga lutea]
MSTAKTPITVETIVNQPVEKAWNIFNQPEHITQWCFASEDWHAPRAENDLRAGGKIKTRMEAKDGSFGFDFEGEYTNVKEHQTIDYVLGDGRKVHIVFTPEGNTTKVTETFDPEDTHSEDMQRGGWQAILDNYRKYADAQ